MIVNLPLRALVAGVVLLSVATLAFVFLTVNGYAVEAATLPVFLGAIVPLFVRQEHLSNQLAEHNDNVTNALNGGLKSAVEQSVTKVITRMAAQDEAGQTSTVAKAATAITGTPIEPPPPIDPPTSGHALVSALVVVAIVLATLFVLQHLHWI